MEMLMLPDDALLMVLEELKDIADILACRLVCKKLATLALHPAVWRDVDFLDFNMYYCVCPVLRLAPCLRRFIVFFADIGLRQRCRHNQWAMASTRCAVAKLYVVVKGPSVAAHAAAIICKQEMLGRLCKLHMTIDSTTDVPVLLGVLASTSRLKRLRVDVTLGELATTPTPIQGSAVVASLREFECSLCPMSEPFVKFVLSQHAATLEEVHLWCSSSSSAFTSTAPLLALAGVTNLSKLTCECLPGMEVLAACNSLRVLELDFNTDRLNRAAVAGAAKLLRRAEHLREVRLTFNGAVQRSVADVGAELVLALQSSSGRSRLEALLIENYSGVRSTSGSAESSCLLQPVVSALPLLSALRRLKLHDENAKKPDKLLLAISPDVAPSLQMVEVNLLQGCAHSWLHGDTVKTVFTVNPSLHVRFYAVKNVCNSDGRCQVCELDCHDELFEFSFACVFSHNPMDACSEDHSVESKDSDDCCWIHWAL